MPLAAVAVAYFVLQLLLFDLNRFVSYDEAQYLAEIVPDVEHSTFGAHRARGIIALVAPVAVFSPPIAAIRLYLAAVSAAFVFLAYRTWVASVGRAAAWAAALWCGCWLSLFYGSEVAPNLFVALCAVAAAGCLIQATANGWSRRTLVALSAWMAFAAFLRPSDSIVLALGLGVSALWLRARPVLQPVLALAAGVALGWLPWFVEAAISFGGPISRLSMASTAVQSGARSMWQEHLALTDGPLMGPQADFQLPVAGVVWWFGMLALAAAALAWTRSDQDGRPVRVAVATAAALAAPYLFVTGALAPRFLLPAYALMAIAVAVAIDRFTTIGAPLPSAVRGGAIVATAVVTLAWTGWGVTTARTIERREAAGREVSRQIGTAVRERRVADRCAVLAEFGHTRVGYASGCKAVPLADALDDLDGWLDEYGEVFAVARTRGLMKRLPPNWTTESIRALDTTWTLAVHRRSASQ